MVRGLKFYMSKIPNGSKDVDIEETIRSFKRLSGRSPLLVFNVSGLIFRLMAKFPAEHIMGGRGQMFLKRLEGILRRMKEAGAEFAFFSDSIIQHASFGTKDVEARKIEKYMKRTGQQAKIYQAIGQGMPLEQICRKLYTHLNVTFYHMVIEVLQEFGPVRLTQEKDRDGILAKYAHANRAYAVIADKGDMLFFEGVQRLWMPETLEFTSGPLKIKELSQTALMKQSRLSKIDQLALFATLIGNDFLPETITKPFHGGQGRYKNISIYVQKLPNVDGSVQEVAIKLLENSNVKCKPDEIAEKIRNSLRYYRAELENSEGNENLDDYLHFSILENKKLTIFETMKFRSETSLNGLADFIFCVYKRLAGVFLKGKDDSRRIEVWTNFDFGWKKLEVKPIYPDFAVPDTKSLTFGASDDYIDQERLKILNFIFEMSWKYDENLLRHDAKHVSFAMALDLMVEKVGIDKAERSQMWDCMLDVQKEKVPDEIEYPQGLNRRTLQITFKFLDLYVIMNGVLKSVGLKKFVSYLPFDAVYFHNSCENNF